MQVVERIKLSPRKMFANNEYKNVVNPQDITIEGLKCILECIVCLVAPNSPPVHRCNNGHIICHVCRPQLTKEKCPVCRIQLGNLRCLTTEKIISDMPINCRFHKQGCTIKLPKEPMKLHEVMCQSSLIRCSEIVVTCTVHVPLLQLNDHLIKDHSELLKYMNEETFLGVSMQLQHGVRGEKAKLWKWGITNQSNKSCQFAKRGCKIVAPKIQLNQHETECDKSDLKCSNVVYNGCCEGIPLLKLQSHLKDKHIKLLDGAKHGQTFYGIDGQIFKDDKLDWPWELNSTKSLFLNGQMFLPILFEQENIVHVWVYILQTDEVAKTYECEITLENRMKRSRRIMFKGPCVHSIFHSKENVVDNKIHLSTSIPSIHDLVKHNGAHDAKDFNYSFTVSKISM